MTMSGSMLQVTGNTFVSPVDEYRNGQLEKQ